MIARRVKIQVQLRGSQHTQSHGELPTGESPLGLKSINAGSAGSCRMGLVSKDGADCLLALPTAPADIALFGGKPSGQWLNTLVDQRGLLAATAHRINRAVLSELISSGIDGRKFCIPKLQPSSLGFSESLRE